MYKAQLIGRSFYSFNNISEAADNILEMKGIWVSGNAETFISKDSVFNTKELKFYCDGVGASYVFYKKTKCLPKKIPGCELWLELVARAKDKKIAIIGATDHVLDIVIKKLNVNGVNIVYSRNGYFGKDCWESITKNVHESGAEIVFIAMGQPIQEKLAIQLNQDESLTILPIGGSLDVYSGIKRRAPEFFIQYHIEWLYRLIKEPKRFFRYLNLFKFIPILIKI